ncbi:hypothetical protein MIMGU_mgv1a025963mg [Erythranthe guttata]|uniref:glucose-6-phosphate 1-epimerase n=1 Tax=Erythranthe guttata TaxID=4155 RepID=A0A022RER9_ERYGU|nr:PREDICTED: putative glucose-6-phosphate 1-epimerase [Erythranthe guttata]EYU37385.1 hypothetical protein MIMGU_mgv1a025963mg [Erythranthe guttata]|eukprot:XP_012837471.1 PREDICTED: putative glucose-6-phosphate 1-epimerase [Erythranthe guttata]
MSLSDRFFNSKDGRYLKIITSRRGDQSVILINRVCHYSVEVFLSNAQIISWTNSNGEELLFVSQESTFKYKDPIRGGMSICFPTFLNNGRIESPITGDWNIDNSLSEPMEKASVDLILKLGVRDRTKWPRFEFRVTFELGDPGDLSVTSRIKNVDKNMPFTFKFAYQTYLAVSNIRDISIKGLNNVEYINYQDNNRFTERAGEDPIYIESEVDRAYVKIPPLKSIAVRDHVRNRTFIIAKNELPDFVLWNPWENTGDAMADMRRGDYRRMLCVGGGAVESEITLNPNEEWKRN